MSSKALAYAWDTEYAGNVKLMLVAIADRSDDEGTCYPGVGKLAKKCSLKERAAQKILSQLESNGEIVVALGDGAQTGHGKTSRYYMKRYRETIGMETPKIALRRQQKQTGPRKGVNTRTGQEVYHCTSQDTYSDTGQEVYGGAPNLLVDPPVDPPVKLKDSALTGKQVAVGKPSSPDGESGGENPVELEVENPATTLPEPMPLTDEQRISQHYQALEGKTTDDALRARIAALLRDYPADWIITAITQSHAAPAPKPKVSDLLAQRRAAEATQQTDLPVVPKVPPPDWYDHAALVKAVQEVFKVRGKQEGYIANMLRGRAKKKSEWGECNLPPDKLLNAEQLRTWAAWWHQQNPNLSIVKVAAKIQSDILLWWDLGCPQVNGPVVTGVTNSHTRFESHKMPGPEKYQLSDEMRQALAGMREKRGEA